MYRFTGTVSTDIGAICHITNEWLPPRRRSCSVAFIGVSVSNIIHSKRYERIAMKFYLASDGRISNYILVAIQITMLTAQSKIRSFDNRPEQSKRGILVQSKN